MCWIFVHALGLSLFETFLAHNEAESYEKGDIILIYQLRLCNHYHVYFHAKMLVDFFSLSRIKSLLRLFIYRNSS